MKLIQNKFFWGFIPGIVIPTVALTLFFYVAYKGELGLIELLVRFYETGKLAPLVGVSVVPNLFLFMQFMKKEYWIGGRGLIFATMLIGLFVVYLKLI